MLNSTVIVFFRTSLAQTILFSFWRKGACVAVVLIFIRFFSPAPAVVSSNASKTPATAALSDADKKKAEEQAKSAVSFDDSQPSTNIQIRLADGTRLVHRFNESSTVSDIRRFIRAARPDYASQNFQLLSGFPSKPLTEDNVSLKDANLLNAAISVKLMGKTVCTIYTFASYWKN